MSLLLLINRKRKQAGTSDLFSILGVSMTGGVFHNLGQLFIAILLLSSLNLVYYFPVMILSGIITGLINGMIAHLLIQALPN